LRQEKISLNGRETLVDIHDALADLSAVILVPTLKAWIKGEIKIQKQDESQASYVRTLRKEDGKIDFKKSAAKIEKMIRAYNPWPGTYGLWREQALKIITVQNEVLLENNHQIGEIFLLDDQLAVQCGQNSLHILRLQAPGKKALETKEFLNGNKDIVGAILK
jgi:methionyl-tRNA formyltransferase